MKLRQKFEKNRIMPHTYLLKFDGELLFCKGYAITIIKVFNGSKKEIVQECLNDEKILDIFFTETNNLFSFNDFINLSKEELSKKMKKYYWKKPNKFFRDVNKTWENNEICSVAFVKTARDVLKIMQTCSEFIKGNQV